jgi:hypothetical protein
MGCFTHSINLHCHHQLWGGGGRSNNFSTCWVKGLVDFSLYPIQEGLFEVFEQVPLIIHVPIPIKAHSKGMMKHKGKEVMEEIGSHAKVFWK